MGLVPSYRLVDTCAAEFEAYTPYYYSTYDRGDDEVVEAVAPAVERLASLQEQNLQPASQRKANGRLNSIETGAVRDGNALVGDDVSVVTG